jgi:hypothetical protein
LRCRRALRHCISDNEHRKMSILIMLCPAINIYSGQILMARFTARSLLQELIEFRMHERWHHAVF